MIQIYNKSGCPSQPHPSFSLYSVWNWKQSRIQTPFIYWKAHFLSEQEKKRRIPKLKYESAAASDDVKITQQDDRFWDNRRDIAGKRVYAVWVPAMYSKCTRTSFSTKEELLPSCCVQWFLPFKDSLSWHYKYLLVCTTANPASKRQPGWLIREDCLTSLLHFVLGLITSLPLLVFRCYL